MLLSMTGYGKAVGSYQDKKITVEIKSLNSKQMDIAMKLPSLFRARELELRQDIANHLERGKCDALIYTEGNGADAVAHINIDAFKAYYHQIAGEIPVALGIDSPSQDELYALILRMPEVFRGDTTATAGEEECRVLRRTLTEALDALTAHRRAEGERLETFFAERLSRIGELLAHVPDYEQERIDKIRQRLHDNLARIDIDPDRARLEQEMIYYIEKLDVTEEKQRLGQHLRYFADTMALPQGGQGKKLGFIAQEMGREINTLGSKSNHADMQALVVKMKDNLEQIKEQVLNVL